MAVEAEAAGTSGTAPEWPETLDVRALLEQGWRPTPFHEFVIKVHSRCNLSCDYCYMYEMADQGWRSQPRRMARPVVDHVARRIAEHARQNLLPDVDVILHGGEPLLAGLDHLRYTLDAIRTAAEPDVTVRFHMQTNAVLLDSRFLDLFDEFGVILGISLDGDEQAHDRHRRHGDGRGSHHEVLAGLDAVTAPEYRHLFGGLLSTIDLRNDPATTYEALLQSDPPGIDFLLPVGNWDTPPPGRLPDESTPYGDWLIEVFELWYRAPEQRTRVRLFHEIIRLLCGQRSHSEAIGLSPVAVVVVETNGRIEQVDTLKSSYDGAPGTALHVSRDPFNVALMLPEIAARQIRHRALAPQCGACHVRQVCGGGLYPHRYRSGTGFLNPSVYCMDLLRLIAHIRSAVLNDLATL
ncbi:FxsB family cyclophane-forming radical SAM/SPASM peptide maturase [Actinomadura sp. 3N407]|uniref:FxsB family cyclophane-forming radical SAM/SPASM peptide maturase n=1 Tax=Actinomadura sp. 3N407 TaxID=3457423 RepID=UPI003FCC3FC0